MTAETPTTHRLTPLLVLTDRAQSEGAGRRLIDTVDAAVEGGARTIVLREKDLSRARRYLLALSLTDLLVPAGAALVVASDVKMALEVGAVAVHLAADDPVPDTTDWPAAMVWGRSCHHVDEVARAAADGAGYVTLSPIFPTASKPGYGPPLGVDALVDAVEAAATATGTGTGTGTGQGAQPRTPAADGGKAAPAGRAAPAVYALGGVAAHDVASCLAAGAAGAAVMGGIMAAADPARATAGYLDALIATNDHAGGASGR